MRIIFLIFLVGCFFSGFVENPQENPTNIKAVKTITNEYKDSERFVEAYLTEANVLYVSVLDNGVDQSRYAQTICNQLKNLGSMISWVKIVKAGSQNDKNADNS